MSRIVYWQYIVDNQGNPLQDAEVRVYLAGTTTEANIYLDASFGVLTTSSAEDFKSNKNGFFQFWVGDEFESNGGYESTQLFKVVWQNTIDGIEEEIDDLLVFAPVLPINTNDSIKGVPSNKDKNKVISNQQGYNWDTHVDSIVPSASPHDLEPVVFFDLDTRYNKVISDKIGYQMYEMANIASTTSIDVSAARFYEYNITSWSTSGGLYYADITHNFNNYYPIIKVIKENTDNEITPKRIQAINPNSTRIWLVENININVIVFG